MHNEKNDDGDDDDKDARMKGAEFFDVMQYDDPTLHSETTTPVPRVWKLASMHRREDHQSPRVRYVK